MNVPNELLLLIFSDVLAAYVHSLVLLPSSCPCWPAHGTLRSVSKQFKVVSDKIWMSAVGSRDVCKVEFRKLRYALTTGVYEGPEGSTTSPLMFAYGAYITALIMLHHPDPQLDNAKIAYRKWTSSPTSDLSSRDWFRLAIELKSKVRPRELANLFTEGLRLALHEECIDALDSQIGQAVRYLTLVSTATVHPSTAEYVIISIENSILLLTSPELARAMDGTISNLDTSATQRPARLTRLNPTLMARLETIVRDYHPLTEDQAQTIGLSSHQQLMLVLASLVERWSREYDAAQSRKYSLDRAIIYGGRRTNRLVEIGRGNA